ncbi:MAG: hypothetical protein ACTSWD_08090 [Candidatus Heimdallarchaeota archaeon]
MKTFEAKIYCGLQKQYSKQFFTIAYAKKICSEYVNTIKWCITFTKTEYLYVDGSEKGFMIGVIRYPRFPLSKKELQKRTIALAQVLKKNLHQNRVTVVFQDQTIMIGNNERI